MRQFIIICVFLALCSKSEAIIIWDTFDRHNDLIKSQSKIDWKPCELNTDLNFGYRNITLRTLRKIDEISGSHFIFSSYSLWFTLGAVSEGTTGKTRQELWDFLMLPQDECLRFQQYQLATTMEPHDEDVKLSRSTTLIIDDSVSLNSDWENFVQKNTLIKVISAPIKSDPVEAADMIRKFFKIQMPYPNFDGNSLIVDTLSYEGLWSDAFSDAIVERAPFFDDEGNKVGYVDMMKIKRRVKMVYIPSMNSKILELPVGFGSRYRMLFVMNVGNTTMKQSTVNMLDSIFTEVLEGIQESTIPLEVAVPRFRMTTEIDMKKILEEMGVSSLWNDVEGTRNMSMPAALPSSFIQRVTVTLDSTGIRPPIQEISNIIPDPVMGRAHEFDTGLDAILGRDFIINRPFMFGLCDSKTFNSLFSGTFSTPTYPLDTHQ